MKWRILLIAFVVLLALGGGLYLLKKQNSPIITPPENTLIDNTSDTAQPDQPVQNPDEEAQITVEGSVATTDTGSIVVKTSDGKDSYTVLLQEDTKYLLQKVNDQKINDTASDGTADQSVYLSTQEEVSADQIHPDDRVVIHGTTVPGEPMTIKASIIYLGQSADGELQYLDSQYYR